MGRTAPLGMRSGVDGDSVVTETGRRPERRVVLGWRSVEETVVWIADEGEGFELNSCRTPWPRRTSCGNRAANPLDTGICG